jgi:hypothetical protein
MQGAQLRYVIKFVADMDKAVKFHRDVLGLKLKFESPGWSEFANLRNRSLHPKLVTLGLYTPGAAMHCYRRFRSAILRKNGCPEDLRKFWLGHENPDISDEYAEQLLEDIEYRQEVAARVGIGFEIPEPSFVPNVPNSPELEAAVVAA